mmetsp:Transcript_40930/g.162097  ORF Transcript_40930/g.162097 Transcript_40930/m.162097 type:complete len:84 (-) Transcript_40930:87-338(-)
MKVKNNAIPNLPTMMDAAASIRESSSYCTPQLGKANGGNSSVSSKEDEPSFVQHQVKHVDPLPRAIRAHLPPPPPGETRPCLQ